MRDLARQLAAEAKVRRRHLHPSPGGRFRRGAVKGRVDLNRGEMAGLEFKPAVGRPILRIERTAPIVEAPGAGSNADFLLLDQIQNMSGGGPSPKSRPLVNRIESTAPVALFLAHFTRGMRRWPA